MKKDGYTRFNQGNWIEHCESYRRCILNDDGRCAKIQQRRVDQTRQAVLSLVFMRYID